MENTVELSRHPLAQHYLSYLRDKNTSCADFRRAASNLTTMLIYEATRDLALSTSTIETPLTKVATQKLNQRIGLVPILRAGLGMLDPALDMLSQAQVWHLGFYRDEETLQPVAYYQKLPADKPVDIAFVLDPMLATGGSAKAALQAVKQWGVKQINMLALIAAPEGIKNVHQDFPEIKIYVCSVDSHLNEKAYIVPGLGDAGDRIFNTLS